MNSYVSYYRREGCYDFCHPKDKQAQYCFDWGAFANTANEMGVASRGFVIDLDRDNNWEMPSDTPLSVAKELEAIYSKYIYTGNLEKVRAIIKFLESIEPENTLNYYAAMEQKHRKEADKWANRLKTLQDEIADENPT